MGHAAILIGKRDHGPRDLAILPWTVGQIDCGAGLGPPAIDWSSNRPSRRGRGHNRWPDFWREVGHAARLMSCQWIQFSMREANSGCLVHLRVH
jgi:hypothetical protein